MDNSSPQIFSSNTCEHCGLVVSSSNHLSVNNSQCCACKSDLKPGSESPKNLLSGLGTIGRGSDIGWNLAAQFNNVTEANESSASNAPSGGKMELMETDNSNVDSQKFRSSLDVRNNIRDMNEVKSGDFSKSPDLLKYPNSQVLPKSPGSAVRLLDLISPSQETSIAKPQLLASSSADTSQSTARNNTATMNLDPFKDLAVLTLEDQAMGSRQLQNNFESNGNGTDKVDVANEYEYVQYARIQSGQKLVDVRLSYATSGDTMLLQQPPNHTSGSEHVPNCEFATEIPLAVSHSEKGVSLSPEHTECGSTDIESTCSETAAELIQNQASRMPNVNDGLSSDEESDKSAAVSPPKPPVQSSVVSQPSLLPVNGLPRINPFNSPERETLDSQNFGATAGATSSNMAAYSDKHTEEYFDDPDEARMRAEKEKEFDTDEETDELLDKQYARNEAVDIPELKAPALSQVRVTCNIAHLAVRV